MVAGDCSQGVCPECVPGVHARVHAQRACRYRPPLPNLDLRACTTSGHMWGICWEFAVPADTPPRTHLLWAISLSCGSTAVGGLGA